MQRGRLYPQIPDYCFAPDFNPRNRPAQQAYFNYTETPLGGPEFTTPKVKPHVDYTDLSLTYSGVVAVGPRTFTWSVVHRVNNHAANVHYTCTQIDDLGNGTIFNFDSRPGVGLWRVSGSVWFSTPSQVTRVGSSTAFTVSWRVFPSAYF